MMKDNVFRFKRFEVRNSLAAQKVGTDAVLLGAAMTLPEGPQCPLRLLDIGTGTGVIALMAAQRMEGNNVMIDAIDIDPEAISEASANFAASPWSCILRAENISLQQLSASLEGSTAAGYDAIFSNPPYFDDSLKAPDGRRSTARHTDTLSYRDILAFASRQLKPEGTLSLILPSETEAALLRSARGFGLHAFRILYICTTAAKPPKRIIAEFRRSGPAAALPENRESIILTEGTARSAAYSALTAQFYL